MGWKKPGSGQCQEPGRDLSGQAPGKLLLSHVLFFVFYFVFLFVFTIVFLFDSYLPPPVPPQVASVEIMYLHAPDHCTPLTETLGAMDEMYRCIHMLVS